MVKCDGGAQWSTHASQVVMGSIPTSPLCDGPPTFLGGHTASLPSSFPFTSSPSSFVGIVFLLGLRDALQCEAMQLLCLRQFLQTKWNTYFVATATLWEELQHSCGTTHFMERN